MSEYTTIHSSRGGSVRDPAIYGTIKDVVTYPKTPRIYETVGLVSIPKNYYVYPKPGEIIFFYEDANGTKRQLRNKNQVNEPQRSGNELVGSTTGKVQKGTNGTFIEVEWINSYIDHNLLRADVPMNDPRVGWVNSEKVEWYPNYIAPEQKDSQQLPEPVNPDSVKEGGMDITTIGFIAVAAAVIFSKKKRRK